MDPTIRIRDTTGVMPAQTVRVVRDDSTGVIRRWRPGEGEKCHLCRTCTIQLGEDKWSVCYKEAAGLISAESAATFAFD